MQAQPETNLSNRENWTLVHTYIPVPWNHMFRYLLNHQQEFFEEYTQDSVEGFVETVYSLAMMNDLSIYGVPDTAVYTKLRAEVVNLHLSYSDHFISFYDMDFYILAGNPNAFAKTACHLLDSCRDTTSQIIGFITSKFYHQNVTDTACLGTVIFRAARCAALQPNYYTARNYSQLLFNRGKKKEAKAQALSAIQFADKAGIDATEEKNCLRKSRR
jgi:hypothetical protein